MLTVRVTKSPPRVTLTEKGANFSLEVALDVYVVCNQSLPSGQDDIICEDSLPLAVTLEMVCCWSVFGIRGFINPVL